MSKLRSRGGFAKSLEGQQVETRVTRTRRRTSIVMDRSASSPKTRFDIFFSKYVVALKSCFSSLFGFRIPFDSLSRIQLSVPNVSPLVHSGSSFIQFCSKLLLAVFFFLTSVCIVVLKPVVMLLKIIASLFLIWMNTDVHRPAPSLRSRVVRMRLFQFVCVLICMGLCLRLYYVQAVTSEQWKLLADKQQNTQLVVHGTRGGIFDRYGHELAVSLPAISVAVHPTWIKDKELATERLSKILEMPKTEVRTVLNSKKKFAWLKRGLSLAKESELRSLKLFGLEIENDFKRVYPHSGLASAIIGRVGRDGEGLSGIERTWEKRLHETSSGIAARRDALGNLLNASVWEDEERSAHAAVNKTSKNRNGQDLYLSLDSGIQVVAERAVDAGRVKSEAGEVLALMMDADTGEILTMAQSRRFDPNSEKSVTPESLRNVNIQNSFEPGSTLKPLIAAIALDHKVVSDNQDIDCEGGRMRVGRHTIRDAHPIDVVPFDSVIIQSSNIGMAKMGIALGKETLYQSLLKLGFGQRTGIELSGEGKGILRNVSRWATVDVATHSFGQGLNVTPLQLVRAYASLANGGYLVTPTILAQESSEVDKERVLSGNSVVSIKRSLAGVVDSKRGTGKNARIEGVTVYGKTGTAQKARVGARGYDPDKVFASFIGFVDGVEIGLDKRLVLYVAVDEPGVRPRWGGTLAAPVFKEIMEQTLSYLLAKERMGGAAQLVQAELTNASSRDQRS